MTSRTTSTQTLHLGLLIRDIVQKPQWFAGVHEEPVVFIVTLPGDTSGLLYSFHQDDLMKILHEMNDINHDARSTIIPIVCVQCASTMRSRSSSMRFRSSSPSDDSSEDPFYETLRHDDTLAFELVS